MKSTDEQLNKLAIPWHGDSRAPFLDSATPVYVKMGGHWIYAPSIDVLRWGWKHDGADILAYVPASVVVEPTAEQPTHVERLCVMYEEMLSRTPTKREFFAVMALQGLLSNSGFLVNAWDAVQLADTLIAELAKDQNEQTDERAN